LLSQGLALLHAEQVERAAAVVGQGWLEDAAAAAAAAATTHAAAWLQGKFVTFYGKNFTADEMAQNIAGHVKKWQEEHPGYSSSSSSGGGTK
jgi:hypothetical protein